MKKQIITLVIFVLALVSIFAISVSAYDYTLGDGHECDFIDENIYPPTCTEEGYKVKVCAKCGTETDVDMEIIPPRGHQIIDGYCYLCQEYIDHEHNMVWIDDGDRGHLEKCDSCTEYIDEVFSHEYGDGEFVNYTDNHTALYRATCTVCGYEGEYTQTVTCRDGKHSYVYDNDIEDYKCQHCGYVCSHTWKQIKLDQTEDNKASVLYECSLCGIRKTEIVDMLNLDQVLPYMTPDQAEAWFSTIFFYEYDHETGQSPWVGRLLLNDDICRMYVSWFDSVVFADIAQNGIKSDYYETYSDLYYSFLLGAPEHSNDYQKGFNDALSSIVEENPVQGLVQGMWSSIILFLVTVGEGVSINGISLMAVFITILIVIVVIVAAKLIGKVL